MISRADQAMTIVGGKGDDVLKGGSGDVDLVRHGG